MSKLLLTALAAVVLAAPAFAQGSTPNGTNIDATFIAGTSNGTGVYNDPIQETTTQPVSIGITAYSHVSLTSDAAVSRTISPGGDGNNLARVTNTIFLATNRPVSAGNEISVNVEGTGTTGSDDEFDELNFSIYGRGVYNNILDIATSGNKGTFATPVFTLADNGTAKTFISGFGQVVASRGIAYDILVSDVAEASTRDFDVTFTVAPF